MHSFSLVRAQMDYLIYHYLMSGDRRFVTFDKVQWRISTNCGKSNQNAYLSFSIFHIKVLISANDVVIILFPFLLSRSLSPFFLSLFFFVYVCNTFWLQRKKKALQFHLLFYLQPKYQHIIKLLNMVAYNLQAKCCTKRVDDMLFSSVISFRCFWLLFD